MLKFLQNYENYSSVILETWTQLSLEVSSFKLEPWTFKFQVSTFNFQLSSFTEGCKNSWSMVWKVTYFPMKNAITCASFISVKTRFFRAIRNCSRNLWNIKERSLNWPGIEANIEFLSSFRQILVNSNWISELSFVIVEIWK